MGTETKGPAKVLGIAGSPRRSGNSEMLLDRFLAGSQEAGADTVKIIAAGLRIAGCIACDGCWEDGRCVIQDDLQDIYEHLVTADIIALATPLYFFNFPAQVKALIDRAQCQWARKFVLKASLPPTSGGRTQRRGVLICTAGGAQPDFAGAILTAQGFFGVHEAKLWGKLLLENVDAVPVQDHPTALQAAYELGVRAAVWEQGSP